MNICSSKITIVYAILVWKSFWLHRMYAPYLSAVYAGVIRVAMGIYCVWAALMG